MGAAIEARAAEAPAAERMSPRRQIMIASVSISLVASCLAGFSYLRSYQPLTSGSFGVGANLEVRAASGSAHGYAYVAGGEIYVATPLHNDGPLPVTVQGLASATPGREGYAQWELLLGDGLDAGRAGTQPFHPFTIAPGHDRGIVIVFRATSDCSILPVSPPAESRHILQSIGLRISTLGVARTARIDLGSFGGAFEIPQPSRSDCLTATR